MIRYAQIALAAGALVAAMPAQAADFIVDTAAIKTSNSTGTGYGNTFTYQVASTDGKSTLNVKATAWVRDFNAAFSAGQLASWGSAGLGVYQNGQDPTNGNYHTIDNVNGWEFVVLQFDQAVSLQSAVLNPYRLGTNTYSDNDAFIGWGSANYNQAMSSTLLRSIASNLGGSFNSDSNDYKGAALQTYNLSPDKSGNVWIIGGSFYGPDNLNDAFKLNTIKVSSGVPEPTTWMMMIAGFGMVGAAVRRRRGAAKASFA